MRLLLDLNSIQLIQIADDRPAILCENFSWLLNNLYNFEPTHNTANPDWKESGRGNRRAKRGDDSESLGYKYDSQADFKPGEKKGIVASVVSKFKEFMNSPDVTVTKKGTKSVEYFGYPFEVEQWLVTAPWPVTDTSKGETYFGPDGGGAYTCEITSRRELEAGKKSRYYVSCNCKDFHFSFKQDLQDHGYTNPMETLPSRGSGPSGKVLPHAPAICKHLYTILMKFYYDDFISKEESAIENPEIGSSGILGGLKSKLFQTSTEPLQKESFSNYTATTKSADQLKAAITLIRTRLDLAKLDKYNTPIRPSGSFRDLVLSTNKKTLKIELVRLEQELETRLSMSAMDLTRAHKEQLKSIKTLTAQDNTSNIKKKDLSKTELKARAERAIINALQDADVNLNSDILDSYEDSRKFSKSKNAPVHYHKYKFEVRVDSTDGKASIYYINPKLAGSSGGQKVVQVPGYSKKDSYYMFSPQELKQLIMKYTVAMSLKLRKQIQAIQKERPVLFFEDCQISYVDGLNILQESSDIKSVLSILKGF